MKLSDYMAERHLKDADFAALINRDPATVCRLRRGKTSPDWETCRRIAEATKDCVTANDFVPDTPNKGAAQ